MAAKSTSKAEKAKKQAATLKENGVRRDVLGGLRGVGVPQIGDHGSAANRRR